MAGIDQGENKPATGASGWDTDLNANVDTRGLGFRFAHIVGSLNISTGQLVGISLIGSTPVVVPFSGANIGSSGAPAGFSYQAVSAGNTGRFIGWGGVDSFAPWSAQIALTTNGGDFYPSITSAGWITNCWSDAAMFKVGYMLADGKYMFKVERHPPRATSFVNCGFLDATSTGVFSWCWIGAGRRGYCDDLAVQTQSLNNYTITVYANSARTTILYNTQVLSGQVSVNTTNFQDDALWPFTAGNALGPRGLDLHGEIHVLSSTALAVTSSRVQVNATFTRVQ